MLTLPLFHAHGLMVGMHGTLLTGASVVLRRKFDASDVLTTINADPTITMFFGVPTMYGRLLAEAERLDAPPRHLRLYVSGSAPLSPQVFTEFERIFGQRILERYGMTETIMNMTNPYDGERRPGTVGAPFPGQEARVVEYADARAAARRRDRRNRGAWAERLRGLLEPARRHRRGVQRRWLVQDWRPGLAQRRWLLHDHRARARVDYQRWLQRLPARGRGRHWRAHPAVAEVAVLGAPDADLGEQVVAVIVLKEGQTPDAVEIIAFCRERLASYKKPRRVVFVESLPRNALGKVQKHLLTERLKE